MSSATDLIKEKLLGCVISIFKRSGIVTKLLILTLFLSAFFLSLRVGLLGKDLKALSYRVVATHLPIIDRPKTSLRVVTEFDVLRDNELTKGKLGGSYHEGDNIILSYSINKPAWVLAVGIDSKNDYLLSTKKSEYKNKGEKYKFSLDDTRGEEVYYIFASENMFIYDEKFKKTLRDSYMKVNGKGPKKQYDIAPSSENITYDYIYFSHK